jgi:hypothetical protein
MGGPGDDVVRGSAGDDAIDGGRGRDALSGGSGEDSVDAQKDDEDHSIRCGFGDDSATIDRGLDPEPAQCERVSSRRHASTPSAWREHVAHRRA